MTCSRKRGKAAWPDVPASTTVVTPRLTPTRSGSSSRPWPWKQWTWPSIRPGSTSRPAQSSTVASPAGRSAPTASIRPSRMRTSRRPSRRCAGSITRPPRRSRALAALIRSAIGLSPRCRGSLSPALRGRRLLDAQPVQTARVVQQHLLLALDGEVRTVPEVGQAVAEVVVPVRHVRGVKEVVVAHVLQRLGQQRLLGLDAEVDLAFADDVAGLLRQPGRLQLAANLPVLVHAIQVVRQPGDARLEEGQLQLRELQRHRV